jgi:hypothetical protein
MTAWPEPADETGGSEIMVKILAAFAFAFANNENTEQCGRLIQVEKASQK